MSGCSVEVIAKCPNQDGGGAICDEHAREMMTRGRGRPPGEVAKLRARLEVAEADNARLRRELSRVVGAPLVPGLPLPEKDVNEWRKIAVSAQALVLDYEVMMRRGERPGLRSLVDAGFAKWRHDRDRKIDRGEPLLSSHPEEIGREVCFAILEVGDAR
jgi:hypothetical protein